MGLNKNPIAHERKEVRTSYILRGSKANDDVRVCGMSRFFWGGATYLLIIDNKPAYTKVWKLPETKDQFGEPLSFSWGYLKECGRCIGEGLLRGAEVT